MASQSGGCAGGGGGEGGVQVLLLTDYRPYILPPSTTTGVLYFGPRIAVFLAAGAATAEVGDTVGAMPRVLAALESLFACFEDITGFTPPLTHAFRGRLLCEVDHLPSAAGLAHHGRAGFAVGPAFLRESLASFGGPAPFLHHVFGYEMFRNFIVPEVFTPPFKHCTETESSWGWLNQGFVNIMGCLALSEGTCGAGFSYFGHSSAAFRAGMEAQLLVYALRLHGVGGAPRLGWRDVFLCERLPWAPGTSLDNLYSGLLSALFRAHGGRAFLRGFFRALPILNARCPAGVRDFHTAAENLYLASCAGAGADVWPLFEALGWPPRREPCCAAVGAMLCA